MLLHSLFDLLAVLAALAIYRLLPLPIDTASGQSTDRLYIYALAGGGLLGAYLFGTLNAWLSGFPGIGRSIEGALVGAIVGVELFKHRRGIVGSTGLRFVAPLALAIAVGRIGCYLAGMEDLTYGTPSDLPWAHDFGDGVPRHPVQLYESLSMAIFVLWFVAGLRWKSRLAVTFGFYLFVGVYAGQRFLWEFLKPYAPVVGPLNLFHILSLGLIAYAIMFATRENRRA